MLRKLMGLLVALALFYLAYLYFEMQGAGGNNPILIIGAGLLLIWGMSRGGNPLKSNVQPSQEPSKIKDFFSTVLSIVVGFGLLLLIVWGIGKFL